MTNKEKYKKAFDVLAASEKISLEVDQMKNKKQKSNYKKSVAAAVAALVFVTAAGSGCMRLRDIGVFWILLTGQLWMYRKKQFRRFRQR